jgi:uncharacterized membrane protein YeaQ/YmgE (transglycosylase-associated protein family)
MTLTTFLLLLVVAGICGTVGQMLAGYSVGGCLVSSVVGFVGAWIGMWLAGVLGLPELLPVTVGGETFPVLWSVIGSTILVLVVALLARGRTAV